jgi:hypothetical protein
MRRLPRWRFRIRPAMRRRIGRVWLDRASYDAFPAAWAVDHHVEEPRDENVATRDGGKSDHRRHAHMMAEATKPHKDLGLAPLLPAFAGQAESSRSREPLSAMPAVCLPAPDGGW